MSKMIIISPSGNFYGSEQVLFDYLMHTSKFSHTFVPKNSVLASTLKKKKARHSLIFFQIHPLVFLYVKIFFILMSGTSSVVYCNEAAHVKYLSLMAKIFPSNFFYIHVRVVEDTKVERWPKQKLENLVAFSISSFIKQHLKYDSLLISDPYAFANHTPKKNDLENKFIFKIGVVGRITKSKGINELFSFVTYLESKKLNNYQFYLFGDLDQRFLSESDINRLKNNPNVFFQGFVLEKDTIYNDMDGVMHFAKAEPLGRIFFEAIDYGKPFVGYNSGGIAEIAEKCELLDFLVEPDLPNPNDQFLSVLESIRENYPEAVERIQVAKEEAKKHFSISKYTSTLDAIFSEQ